MFYMYVNGLPEFYEVLHVLYFARCNLELCFLYVPVRTQSIFIYSNIYMYTHTH